MDLDRIGFAFSQLALVILGCLPIVFVLYVLRLLRQIRDKK